MKIIKVLSLFCFLTINLWAQTGVTVSGIVSNLQTPLVNAEVVLTSAVNQSQSVKTDANGRFVFENVARGKYRIDVRRPEDNQIFLTQEVIVENKALTVDLTFGDQRPSAMTKVGEVFVIASGRSQSIDEVSKTVNVIDAQELRDRADFSLVESLQTIPGFRVQQLGGFGRTASIKTRGLRNQDTAVLLDGIRFRDASAITGDASSFLSDFTLTSVSKIEVLRGSGSSLYGTNAIGGTVDFQTPKPQSGWHGQIGGAFGGLGLGRFRGNVSGGGDRIGFNAGVSRTVYTKGIDGDDDARNTNFQSRVDYNPFDKTNISARFFVSDAFVRLNSNPDTAGILPPTNATIINARKGINFVTDVDDPDDSQKSKFFNGQVVVTQIITDKLIFQGYYSGLKTRRTNDNGTLGIGFQSASTSVFDGTIQTVNGHFNYSPNKVNEITFGYEFEHEKFGNNGFTPTGTDNFFTRARQSSNTFYAQDLISLLNDKLQLAGGFRAQIFSLKTPEFSLNNAPYANLSLENPPTAYTFDGSAAYFFSKTGTKFRAHVGNGYRTASLYERFGTFFSSFGTPSFVALGDPNLKPEKTIAFDAGIEQNVFKGKALLSATWFYTKLLDTIGFGNVVPAIGTTTRPFGGYLNTKGGIARGAELSGKIKASETTDIFASYTFTNSDQLTPQVTGNSNIATLGISAHQFTLVANQRFGRAWVNFDFLATSNYLAPIFDTNNFTFQTYVYRFKGNRKGDLTGGYTFGFREDKLTLRVYGTAENLFDDEYFENGFRTSGISGRLGLSFGF